MGFVDISLFWVYIEIIIHLLHVSPVRMPEGGSMKLVSFEFKNRRSCGVVLGRLMKDLESMQSQLGKNLHKALQNAKIEQLDLSKMSGMASDEIRYVSDAISNPNKALFIGINYSTHIKKTDRDMSVYPMISNRFVDTQVAHEQAVIRSATSHKLDLEKPH